MSLLAGKSPSREGWALLGAGRAAAPPDPKPRATATRSHSSTLSLVPGVHPNSRTGPLPSDALCLGHQDLARSQLSLSLVQ